MSQPALVPTPNDDQAPSPDRRRAYEEILLRAMWHAERMVPRDQAFEVAHDVAVELLPDSARLSGALIYLRVTSRVRNLWRARERRAAVDGAYAQMWSSAPPAWAQPGADLEARELRARVEQVMAEMPSAMRETFLLVREDELSYKEAAARLGVSVNTVHKQLSRANALLRDGLKAFRADGQS
jgi:RNA polymerase sigma factor (sigma-70 family)